MSYYNTTNLEGPALEAAKLEASTQVEKVRKYFDFVGESTPSEVWTHCFQCRVPITSVRRAISDLTNDGHLTKTDIKRRGIYDKPEHVWRLWKPADNQQNLFNK